MEPGETIEQAIVREVAEETGLDVRPELFLTALEWPTPHARIIYLYFYAKAATTAVRLGPEHDRHDWLTLEEQQELELAPHFKNLMEHMETNRIAHALVEKFAESGDLEEESH